MPTAKKTKSGKWKATIYDYKDSAGKVHQKTFTADTKREAERMANEYKSHPKYTDLTVGDAVSSYIKVKTPTLSPSTVKGYTVIYRCYFKSSRFGSVKISALTNVSVQRFISDLVSDGKTPKTVKNIYGLLLSSVSMYRPDCRFAVTLPAAKKPELYTPTTAEVNQLMESIKKDRELYIAVLLCTFGPMRRSEACGVKYEDINYKANTITVRRARVMDSEKKWIYKDLPKNYSSYRTIPYPESVIKVIGKGFGYVISKSNPNNISDRFADARSRAQLPHFRLHDLRHYSASILHAIGIPDQYIMARGGWKTDQVMKRVYRDTISDVEREMNDKINSYFSEGFRVTI